MLLYILPNISVFYKIHLKIQFLKTNKQILFFKYKKQISMITAQIL